MEIDTNNNQQAMDETGSLSWSFKHQIFAKESRLGTLMNIDDWQRVELFVGTC